MADPLSLAIAEELVRLALQIAPHCQGHIRTEHRPKAHTTRSYYLDFFHRKLLMLNRGLTGRELDVCARAMMGITAEGTALDLNIKKSSVITYRKRAYERLGISSQNELMRLIIARSGPLVEAGPAAGYRPAS